MKKSPTVQEREKIVFVYRDLMMDIKARIRTIEKAYTFANEKRLHHSEAQEIAYLQIRMICELIALSCLTAHNELITTNTGKMRKIWQPDKIFSELEKLHPDFYPIPDKSIFDAQGKPITVPQGARNYKLEAVRMPQKKGDFLTKNELVSLFGKCGDKLHIGGTQKYFGKRIPDQAPIRDAIARIQNLLRVHRIKFIDPEYFIWAQLEPREAGSDPLIALFSLKPAPPTNSQM